MIVCCGENVVDLIIRDDGAYQPVPGGSALNIAIGLGRMGNAVGYAMPVAADVLGDMLVAALACNDVVYLPPARPARPTGLAMVNVAADGQPSYSFYRHGAADTEIDLAELPSLGTDVRHLHLGGSPSLGHDRCGETVLAWLARQPADLSCSLDPNVRPSLVDDKERFLARCDTILRRCAVCRLSEEDADYMYGSMTPDAVADILLGKGVGLAVVTQGEKGALLANACARVSVAHRVPRVKDTVAAGDTFMAGLLTMLRDKGNLAHAAVSGLGSADLEAAGRFAVVAAAINCTRDGCDPPTMAQVHAELAVVE